MNFKEKIHKKIKISILGKKIKIEIFLHKMKTIFPTTIRNYVNLSHREFFLPIFPTISSHQDDKFSVNEALL